MIAAGSPGGSGSGGRCSPRPRPPVNERNPPGSMLLTRKLISSACAPSSNLGPRPPRRASTLPIGVPVTVRSISLHRRVIQSCTGASQPVGPMSSVSVLTSSNTIGSRSSSDSAREALAIAPPALPDAIIQRGQLRAEHGGVQRVQPLVETFGDEPPEANAGHEPVLIVHAEVVPVVAQHCDSRGNVVVLRRNDAGVAGGAKYLR